MSDASAAASRQSILKYLYNHNPFYAISAVLMLYSIRAAYGTLEIGTINCWIMMGVLAGYTLVLAAIGVMIVRWAKVWEDARSILLLLLLLFLAVSISADDLFVKMATSTGGTALLLCGYLFSAIVSEAVLWAAGIRIGLRFRLPYHLMLALFFVAPWWCTPELHPRPPVEQAWTLFLFPVAAALLFLCLFPAARGGEQYLAGNGTPWPWPWFPWTAFGMIAAAVSLRSYALCMTFGLSGPIWKELPSGKAIVFDTIWGPYFLVPLALAVLVLLLEMGLVSGNRRFVLRVVQAAPLLLLLALPLGGGPEFRKFLQDVTATVGAPLWLTTWLLIGFYVWAWIRRAPAAGAGAVTTATIVSVVGPRTIGLRTLAEPQPWPFLVIGAVLFVHGLWNRSSRVCALSAATATIGLWLLLPQTALADFRMAVSFHFLWLAVLTMGLTFRDPFARVLRAAGAVAIPVAALVVMSGVQAAEIPMVWRLPYVVLLAALCLLIARLWRSSWFLYSFGATTGALMYAFVVFGFRRAVDALGRASVTAFAWSLGMLLLAFLISAHKARWLPRLPWPPWRNGSRSPRTSDPPKPADGLSTDASP